MAKGLTTNCPHCGVKVHFEPATETVENEYGEELDEHTWAKRKEKVFIGICPSCHQSSLVGREALEEEGYAEAAFTQPKLVKKPESGLPEEIRDALDDIYRCDSVNAHRAVAVMGRRFLEKCCSIFGSTKGKLPRRIEGLLKDKLPNETLLKMAHLVRCIGDEGAHAFGEVGWEDAKGTVAFCEELAHHLFITEKRFQKIVERRKKEGRKTG